MARWRSQWRSLNMGCCIYLLSSNFKVLQLNLPTYYAAGLRGNVHSFESQEFEDNYDIILSTVDPVVRAKAFRAIGDHNYNNYTDMPLAKLRFVYTINPKFIASWAFAGIGNSIFGEFEKIKAVR